MAEKAGYNGFDKLLDEHLATLAERIHDVPELAPVRTIISDKPEHARDVYLSYLQLIGRMASLTTVDIERIDLSQRKMAENEDEQDSALRQGSASKVGANKIVRELGNPDLLNEYAVESVDPDSEFYGPALFLLQKRLEDGHIKKYAGKTPTDADPASHRVIWGHTVITDPEALLHFTVCHYLERFFAEALNSQGLQLAQDKDFFINALDDVVILDHLNGRGDETIYDMWSRPKEKGGLGWITPEREASYKK